MNRFATVQDLPSIADLRFRMFDEIGTTGQLTDNFLSKTINFYTSEYENKVCIHVVSESDNSIIGCAGGLIRKDEFLQASFKQPNYGYLMDVYVLPNFRRKGVARSMIEMLWGWFEASNISTVNLDASRLSGDLYEKLGFKSSIQMTRKINT
ncbi:GNAT family N-acetyltransferase [Puniceicoccus vermicola]|uniref:GNAT family N-acetyltransferase n=2 Tax=Puniceicoccus vermicola TaxID=388746 RepID=A0A7X1E6K4_9BACT|nr:GNAT family N-acetyltransferase [Puniceicoccus vermicola]MBC2604339.1 GNAT family N-acetyltransferase [Puniceicoccus vermicola]